MDYTPLSSDPDSCSVFQGASVANFIVLCFITVGIFISYIPQYVRIHRKRTSEGLSTNFLLLGSSSSLFTLTNIILVSSKARWCCSVGGLSVFNCVNSQLNLIQIGTQCTCAILILVFVIVWTRNSIKQDKEEYARIVRVAEIVAVHAILCVLQIVIAHLNSSLLIGIASINGLLSTTLTVAKYVPQIWTTFKLKHPGTLSIGMMCIQTPGGFIFATTLILTKGSHWSSWLSYLFAATLQGLLLLLCIYYEYFLDAEAKEATLVERIVEENLENDQEVRDIENLGRHISEGSNLLNNQE